MKKVIVFNFILLSLIFNISYAQITMPSVFSDNMVLQRESNVKFWGWAGRGSTVKIIPSWSNDTLTVKASGHAKFELLLKTPKAGGPYFISIYNGRYKHVINNILIGEVWLASGQSNMEWNSYNKLKEMIDELPESHNDQIRLLHVNRHGSFSEQENFENKWKVSGPLSAQGFSAIGYFFAKKMQKELGVPIGIISSSIGGTSAEVWVPDTVITNNPLLSKDASSFAPAASRPHEPGTLWNTMIKPLVGYNLAGVLWYQGESNIRNYSNYDLLMKKLVNTWRTAWKQDLPFYFVQIAPYNYKSKPEKQLGALLREQQVKLLELDRTGMVVVSDLVDDVNDIHPVKKKEVANRLADLALVEIHQQKKSDYRSPIYKSHEIKKDKVIIDFNFLENGLMVKDNGEIIDLLIADDSKEFKKAEYQIKGNQLIVFNKSIKNPTAVRFSFKDTSISNLFSKSGLPVAPFRTDNWDL